MKRLLLFAIVALALPAPAHAAFPGQNGKIAFVDYWERISTVYPNGTGTAHLASAGIYSYSPHWSPDGSQLVFAAPQDSEAPSAVYKVNSDGTGLQLLRLNSYDPSWTANGKILFGDLGIRTMNADGTGSTLVPNTTSSDLGPAGSPDGSKDRVRTPTHLPQLGHLLDQPGRQRPHQSDQQQRGTERSPRVVA